MASSETHVDVAGQRVRVSSPDKVLFPEQGWTKLDVVEHFLACGDGAVRAIEGRPCQLKRWPRGVGEDPFYERRTRPSDDVETATVRFHSARRGPMWIPRSLADIVRMVHLNAIDLHPWPVVVDDMDHPDELRIDLDPTPGHGFDEVREVAAVVRDILTEDGLVGWPKTSGSRGIHVYVRLERRWTFIEVRRAVLAIAREAERRTPLATSRWWKEEREGVFVDFNQMARDKTVASAYSVRQTGYVSAPFLWGDLDEVAIEDFPMDRFADRYAEVGDLHAPMEDAPGDLTPTLARVAADEEAGLGDAPWPPHYHKQPDEPRRVSPSRAREDGS
jgi:bifunctional non-homologous end joining protein LigD